MIILSKYTKTKDVTNINNVTQKEYLESIGSNSNLTTTPNDYYQPFTYEQWHSRNVGIISGQEYKQYELYLKNWSTTRYTATDFSTDLKSDYIAFLQNLSLLVDKNDTTAWLNDIDWTDTLEVEQAIPIYARKLKEIAIYLINKRDALKRAKLKYNMTGATQALEKLFYEYFLKAFTKRDYVLNVPDTAIYSSFPDLSAVKNGFQIQIQELYDDSSYFDKNPIKTSEFYFDLNNFSPEVTGYYDSQNISPSAYEWAFRTGFNELSSDNPLFFIIENVVNNTLPVSAYIDMEDMILNEYYKINLSKKYIGENQYYVTSGYYIPWTTPISYNLIQGNNWFYWPSGEYVEENTLLDIDPIPLVNTNLSLNGAKGSHNYLDADKIFIRVGNTVSGAWLKYDNTNTDNEVMSAGLYTQGTNIFKFPFPGYGVSGEDITWTGEQLSNLSKDYEYLEDDIKTLVKKAYWTNTTIGSSICAVNLNESTLIDDGATAGLMYDQADNICVRITTNPDMIHDETPDTIYQSEIKHAWLYKMENTDIPIVRGQNYINWPIERYDQNNMSGLFGVLTSTCNPIALSSIELNNSFVGARAGYNLFDSDIIYKLDKRGGTPIECAFLSGQSINMLGGTTFTANATGIMQPALTLNCTPNNEVTFIWTDENIEIKNLNIQHKAHQSDCPYVFEKHHSLYTENPNDQKDGINYKAWQKCECKSIQYSPLGHAGDNYDEYSGFADIIYLDLLYPLPFNKTIWSGRDGKDYKHSKDFAWFQLDNTNQFQSDVGWGSGKWITGDGSEFTFIKGYQYKYLRNDLGHSATHLTDGTVPNLIIKVPHTTPSQAKWVKAVADSNGNWQNYAEISDMMLNPKDYLVYDHIDSNWYCITGIGDYGTTITYNASTSKVGTSNWLDYDFVTSGKRVGLSWPDTVYTGGPTKIASEIETIYWKIVTPTTTVYHTKTPEDILYIECDQLGTYQVSVTGIPNVGSNLLYNNVCSFIASPELATYGVSGALDINTIYADTINMSINVSLSGWNYNNHTYDGISKGARPFWAYASDKNDKITKHKGIDVWGGGIRVLDEYTLITQPEFSDISLPIDTTVEYTAQNNLVWKQPVTFNVLVTSSEWCDLMIDTTKVANLSSYLYNINTEMIVSATNTPSTLILSPLINEIPVFINYYANSAFTWTEILSNSTLGLPPTGGVYVNIVTGTYLEATVPYENLTNRHFPTIATVAHVEELYSTEDSGGYFVPRLLGVTTALAKNTKNVINGMKIPNNGEGTKAFETFTNVKYYTSDNSLSKTDQNIVLENEDTDSGWMKASITNWNKAGTIVEAAKHQQFIPYKTKYETTGQNDYGIHQQGDTYDPWYGEMDNIWENTVDWPTNFTKQYNIEDWYTQFAPQELQVYQWKTDIFNNQYALLKPILNNTSIYDKKHNIGGTLWVRNGRNIVQPASTLLSDVYTTLSGIDINLNVALNNNILDVDMFYDTLMYYTASGIIFAKLSLDYTTGTITSEINESTIISLNSNKLFGGTWLTDDKMVTICTLLSAEDQIRPILTQFDINNNITINMYNVSSMYTNMSAYNLIGFDHPVMSYNKNNDVYNVSYVAYGTDKSGMYLNNINIKNMGDSFEIIDIKTIEPDGRFPSND